MSSDEFKRIFRSIFFILSALLILYCGLLPGDFSKRSFPISPVFFAWSAAFIVFRPGSVGIIVIVITAIEYLVLNDEGVALGSLEYLIFCLVLHELREYFENQSFLIEMTATTLTYIVIDILKNLLLQIFFTQHANLFTIAQYALYFILAYIISSIFIKLVFGRKAPSQKE